MTMSSTDTMTKSEGHAVFIPSRPANANHHQTYCVIFGVATHNGTNGTSSKSCLPQVAFALGAVFRVPRPGSHDYIRGVQFLFLLVL